jgi:hypothetical protein
VVPQGAACTIRLAGEALVLVVALQAQHRQQQHSMSDPAQRGGRQALQRWQVLKAQTELWKGQSPMLRAGAVCIGIPSGFAPHMCCRYPLGCHGGKHMHTQPCHHLQHTATQAIVMLLVDWGATCCFMQVYTSTAKQQGVEHKLAAGSAAALDTIT